METSKQIDITVGNNSQNILPVPIIKNPASNVAYPIDYGKYPYADATGLRPTSRKNDPSQYCNTLSPPPRNQQLNVPYQGDKYCPKFKAQPYSKDSCYLMDNKKQGVIGVVCNQAGGSDNANFVRGNQFGVDYQWDLYDKVKTKEFIIEKPVQTPVNLENPTVVDNETLFYPTTNYYYSKSNDYKTYPRPNNFTTNGLPTYVYPYKTLNKRTKQDNDPVNYNYDKNRNNLANIGNIEDFVNMNQNKQMMNILILLFIIIIILTIIYLTRR